MKKIINAVTGVVTFTFDGAAAVVFNTHDMTPENQQYAICHGMAARIGDNAAITKSAENGFAVTETMRREAVLEMVTHYTSGSTDWELRKSAGPRKPALNPTWVKMAEMKGCDYATIAAEMAERDIAELMAMTSMVAPRG